MIENLEWFGIVLLWFWPLTLGAIAVGFLIYLAIAIRRIWPGANW